MIIVIGQHNIQFAFHRKSLLQTPLLGQSVLRKQILCLSDIFHRHLMSVFFVEPTLRSKQYRYGVVRISNLPSGVSTHDIHRQFRNVLWAAVQFNSQKRSLGYAFVRFRTSADAAAMIKRFNGFVWKGRELHIYYNEDILGLTVAPRYIPGRLQL